MSPARQDTPHSLPEVQPPLLGGVAGGQAGLAGEVGEDQHEEQDGDTGVDGEQDNHVVSGCVRVSVTEITPKYFILNIPISHLKINVPRKNETPTPTALNI